MTKSMKQSETKRGRSELVRVCPEMKQLIDKVKATSYIPNDAMASKAIYDSMIFDPKLTSLIYKRKV